MACPSGDWRIGLLASSPYFYRPTDSSMTTSRPAEFGDDELVTLAQKGQREAFEVLVERYKQKAYRITFDFTRDREEAKDLSQEAFLRAFTHLKGFDLRASFYTWFYRILVNLCLDYHRRKGRISWESLDERTEKGNGLEKIANPGPAPDQEAMRGELSHQIGDALATLPPKQRIRSEEHTSELQSQSNLVCR